MGVKLTAAGEIPGAAVAGAVAVAGRSMFVDAEQVALELGDHPDNQAELGKAIVAVRGRGRPKGALNQRTGDWRDYLASQYRHPLVTLAQIQAEDPDKLAAELGCKPIEALAVIKSAAAELAPYMEGKMPVVVEARGRGHMTLVMASAADLAQMASGSAAGSSADTVGAMLGFNPQGNQGVSSGDQGQSE